MSRCDLDLWPTDLDNSCYITRHVFKVCTKFEWNRAIPGWIIDNFANFAHVISHCDLDLWPLDLELLQHFEWHAFILCTKSEQNRIIHGWVTHAILGVGQNWHNFFRSAWTQLHQTWPRHRAIIPALHFCFRIWISCCIFKRGRLKVEWCCKRRQILHFLTPCKNCGRSGRDPSTNCWSFTYDRTSEIHLMAVLCVAAEHGGFIKRNE